MLTKLLDNLTSNLCIVVSAYMAMAGNQYFGWFLIVGVLFPLCRGIISICNITERFERSATYYHPEVRK